MQFLFLVLVWKMVYYAIVFLMHSLCEISDLLAHIILMFALLCKNQCTNNPDGALLMTNFVYSMPSYICY